MSYTRVNWENSPSIATPLSAENLNIMDEAIETLSTDVEDAQDYALALYSQKTVSSTSIATFDDGADNVAVKKLVVGIEPVQATSGGDPSPTNICEITGWDTVTVSRASKNLINYDDALSNSWINTSTSSIATIDGANVFFASVPKNTTLTISADKGNRFVLVGFESTPETISGATYDNLLYDSASQLLTYTFNTGDNVFIAVYTNRDSSNKPTWIQLEIGSSATDYEEYDGNTYSIALGDTYYGGTLNVTTGVLTVDRALIDLGDLSWTFYGSGAHQRFGTTSISSLISPPSSDSAVADIMCTGLTVDTNSHIYNQITDNTIGVGANATVYAYCSSYSTASDFKSAMSGIYLLYPLATTTTVQLTETQVTTLLGDNVIYADSGDIESLIYREDFTTTVDDKIGDLDDLQTTSQTDLVSAINEVDANCDTNTTNIATNTSDIAELKEELEQMSGISDDVKTALLQIAQNVAYDDVNGQTYYNALYNALYPPADLVSISAVYTQSGTVYDTASLDDLRTDLVVTGTYDDSSTRTITDYTLSGTLTVGTSAITVSYGGKTTSFNVTVTEEPPYDYYDYIQGDGTAYIDTGLLASTYCTSSYGHELQVAHGASESDRPIYGSRQQWGNANSRIIWQSNLKYTANYCANGYTGDAMTTESLYDSAIIKTGTDKKLYFNGTEIADWSSGASPNITNTYNILLFCQSNGASGSGFFAIDGGYASPPSKCRIYYFKVTDANDELVANLIPAQRRSDNAVGMYDTVRDTFYTNARDSGTLTLGNE